MIDWYDYIQGAKQAGFIGSTKTYRPPKVQFGGHRSWAVSNPASTSWATNRRLAPPPGSKPSAYKPAGFPERVDFSLPLSAPPAPPPANTEGDILGSIGKAFGDTLSQLNLANAIPWFMERMHVLATEFADADTFVDPLAEELRGRPGRSSSA